MKELIEKIFSFEKEMDNNKLIVKEKFECLNTPAIPSLISIQRELKMIESTVLDFYELAGDLVIKWKAVDPELLNYEMVGSVKVNTFSQVVVDWNGVVFFDDEPMDSEIRAFFPLDFFADEAAVGYCTKEGWRNTLYLYQFDGDLISLHVNFKSYIQLMLLAKGCFYWQYLILEIIKKEENEISGRIKKYLQSVFPDFSFLAFEKLFNELRIN
jgi:hypothetical protein